MKRARASAPPLPCGEGAGGEGRVRWVKRRAKELRAEMTPHEKIMWRLLHQGELAALNWRKQSPFGAYVIDFVSHPARLVIEVDGAQHSDADIVETDAERTAWLTQQGYRVLRFWNFETVREQDGVWRTIYDAAAHTNAAPRMARWRDRRLREVTEQNAHLPLDGGGGRAAAGGGARAGDGDEPPEASLSSQRASPPQSSLRPDSSPIEGERGACREESEK
ncbi:MAG: DUF559 domain-containing protein [Terricaulis sp.]